MASTGSRLKAAIIGAGRRGKAHAAAAAGIERVRLVAVSDVDDSRARELAGRVAGEPYSDWRSMLAEVRPELVYVTSPPPLHAEQTIAALAGGAHVVLEKPIALTMREAAAIGAEAERTGRHVQVPYRVAARTLGVVLAANRSNATGKAVQVEEMMTQTESL